jgi:NodT family efflux transporter outer membrane factor (OMF) lipoprotein
MLQRGCWFLILGLTAGTALGLCGCTSLADWVHNGFKVGPNYQPPPAALPEQWIDAHDPLVRHGDPNIAAWWDVFDDPILAKLLHDSYANNLTLREAGLQILQSKIQRNIALSELLPQSQTFLAQYTHGVVSRNGGVPPGVGPTFGTGLGPSVVVSPVPNPSTPINGGTPFNDAGTTTTGTSPAVNGIGGGGAGGAPQGTSRFFNNVATSLNLSWELDFWGLFRRNLEAANASLDQSLENFDEMLVLLLANVATQYVEIRTLQKRLELARKNVAQQEPLVDVYYKRYKAGIANSYPGYFQLKSNLENTKALIPQLEISLREANNQLCTLLGVPVHDLLPELGDGTVPDPADPSKRTVRIPRPRDYAVVVGIPGEFLMRRPDVQAAESQLRIQSAQIGIAEAEMFPHIGINGSIGLAANHFGRLFDQQSWTGNIGPSLTWSILNYGRLLANVRFQDLQFQQFVLSYQQTILNANQDAENSMVAYLKSLDQTQHLQSSADAAAKLTDYLLKQYREGFLPPGAADTSAFINQIFTAINFQVTQQDSAAQAEGNIALNLILLYRAMGGGWQIRLADGNCVCADVGVGGVVPSQAAPTPGREAAPLEKLPPPKPVPPPVPKPEVQPDGKASATVRPAVIGLDGIGNE